MLFILHFSLLIVKIPDKIESNLYGIDPTSDTKFQSIAIFLLHYKTFEYLQQYEIRLNFMYEADITPESNPVISYIPCFLDLWTPGTSWDNGTVLNER